MRTSRRLMAGIAAGALSAALSMGCAARQPEIQDTWSPAAQRAEAAAQRAETAAQRAEAAATRVEAAAQRAENAAARVEAMVEKSMRK
ncbi:MAG: alanine-zipper protein [Candidatus Binatia bacterium]|nr:alanine-zipper protein [Candidatus Binatia bacterium]